MIIKLILSIICILTLFGRPVQASTPLSYDVIAGNLMKTTADRLAIKHKLHLGGLTKGMMGCVKLMGFTFQLNRKMGKDEARAMLVNCVQEFLADINQNESLRKDLQVYPFDAKHVEIVIFLSTYDYGDLYYPDLSVIAARHGELTYFTHDSEHEFKYKTREVESFEDAVKIVQSQNPPQKLAE